MENKLDLLLINPSLDFKKDIGKYKELRVQDKIPRQHAAHIGIAYLLAICKKEGISVKYIDMITYEKSLEEVIDFVKENKPKMVGFTAFTVQIKAAGHIAEKIKEIYPDTIITAGGPHVTAIPKETLKEFPSFDFVVRGEADKIFPNIFRSDLTDVSKIKGVVTREKEDITYDRVENLDELPFPAWEEFDLKLYPGCEPHRTKQELFISTSRGCPNFCVFCVRPFGQRRTFRSILSIIEEIERNIKEFDCQAINFCDETFTANIDFSKKLFEKMIELGLHKKIRWSCETRVDNASPEMFKLMKEAGCYYVFFGFESADDEMLKRAGKGFDIAQIKKAVGWAKDAELICAGSFILGLPGETEETAMKSVKLAKELDIYSTTFPIAVPFPGTPIREMADKGMFGLRILTSNWDDYGKQYPGVMESENLSIDRLRELQEYAYKYNPKKDFPKIIDYLSQNGIVPE
ncbi:radical SAM protein [Candidatus Pacearchaeota archaeon]|nr:radical SAM protein [Candidatus Pacearchaeota archaeon]